jgi:hypothetical protein
MAEQIKYEIPRIERLEGAQDYWEWKYAMILQLKARKFWGHVDGSTTLADDATQEAREMFELTAVPAQAFIVAWQESDVNSDELRLCQGGLGQDCARV